MSVFESWFSTNGPFEFMAIVAAAVAVLSVAVSQRRNVCNTELLFGTQFYFPRYCAC